MSIYSLLATVEAIFNLATPGSNDTSAAPMSDMLAAKIALYLKESLGTRTSVLSKLMDAFSASEEEFRTQNPKLRRVQLPLNGGRGAN